MSPATIALIVVAVSIVAWALFMVNVTVRRQRKASAATREHPAAAAPDATATAEQPAAEEAPEEKPAPAPRRALTPSELAVSRRQFLNRAWTASFTAFLGFFGMSSLSFLWPKLTGGFGTKINAGSYEEILSKVGPAGGFKPLFIPEGRFFLVYYEGDGDAPAYELVGAKDAKLVALYRKCVHLGCSVPHCPTSSLFECPCHGSKYRLHGEYYGGPAPRGLDRVPIALEGDNVVVDTGTTVEGPPRGTDTWQKFAEPQGSFCVPT